MAANKERLQKRRQEGQQATPAAAVAGVATPAMPLTPTGGGTGSGDGWGSDSMAVPAGWPASGQSATSSSREADSPGAFGGSAGGWGDVVAGALSGDGPKPSPAVGDAGIDLLGFSTTGAAGTGGADGMLGAGQLDAGMFTMGSAAPAPAPAIGGGVDLLGGAATAACTIDLLGVPAASIGDGGIPGFGQLDASLFAPEAADGAASSPTAAAQPGTSGGGDGWGASAMAIPEGWPGAAVSGSSNGGWGDSALAIPDGWPTPAPAPVPAPASGGVDLLGGGAAGSAALLSAPSTSGGVDLLGGAATAAGSFDLLSVPAASMGGGSMLGAGQLDASLFEATDGAAPS